MKRLQVTKQFKKDINRLKKQNKDFNKLKLVIEIISRGESLDKKYRDHKLVGNYVKARECHIEPDWLLIYELYEDVVKLRRTGSHVELFNI